MYQKTTHNIVISVTPQYLTGQSKPDSGRYIWTYTITIKNTGTTAVQLQKRFWQITDGRGRKMEVRGTGVVGETPVIEPNGIYEYTSGCPLSTSSGIMVGHYEMTDEAGENFKVDIPAFALESNTEPDRLH